MASETNADRPVSGWVGWILFAATIMIISGTLSAIEGLSALLRDHTFFLVTENQLLTFNYTTWGWIHLILGTVLVIVGALLIKGSVVGTVLAGIIVSIHLISQFAWIGAYPWWSIIVIALDILVLYTLFVHGDELASD